MKKSKKLIYWLATPILKMLLACPLVNPFLNSPKGRQEALRFIKNKPQIYKASKATRKHYYFTFYFVRIFIAPFQILRFYLAEKRMPPSLLLISITTECNLRCGGCFAAGRAPKQLSYNTVERIIKEANAMGLYFVILIGGEPFCWPDTIKIMQRFPNTFFSIYTNGTLLDEDLAESLADCGNCVVYFSVEGFQPETDERRGVGVFDKILASMELLRQKGVGMGLSVTVTKNNNDLVMSRKFVEFFFDRGVIFGSFFNYFPSDGDMTLVPTPEQRFKHFEQMSELRKINNIFVFDLFGDGELTQGCLAGGEKYIHINASGQIEPCMFYQYSDVNIHDVSLKDALNSPLLKEVRKNHQKISNHKRPCPVLDNPQWSRQNIKDSGALPTNPKSNQSFIARSKEIDKYAASYKKIIDEAEANANR